MSFSNYLSPIDDIVEVAKSGRMFILIDDESRENEGDLVIPAEHCGAAQVNFMAKHGRGLICLALTRKRVEQLGLPLMAQGNESRLSTAFTVSIEAREGITTGISAADRARTIEVAIDPNSTRSDLATPGHPGAVAAEHLGADQGASRSSRARAAAAAGLRHRGPDPEGPRGHGHDPSVPERAADHRDRGLWPAGGRASAPARRARPLMTGPALPEGHPSGGRPPGGRPHLLIVEARFYDDIADLLLAGATRALEAGEATFDRVTVPGALEIPAAIRLALEGADYDAFVALGCVIRGETSHYDIVAGESARGLIDLGVQRGALIGNGILTTDHAAQARVRADPGGKDKGGAAARAALALLQIKRCFRL